MTDVIKNWRDMIPPSLSGLAPLFGDEGPRKIENFAGEEPHVLGDFLVCKAVEMRTPESLRLALPHVSPTSPYRLMIASKLAKAPAEAEALAEAALRDFVLHDPDPQVVDTALQSLKRLAMTRIVDLAAERAGDLERIGQLHESLSAYKRGLHWPHEFLRGKTVHAPTKAGRLSFLFTGDLWRGDRAGITPEVVSALGALARKRSSDFGVLLGDSIDMSNLLRRTSLTTDEIEAEWQAGYGGIGLPFWACVGNKDWFGDAGPGELLVVAQRPNTLNLPAISYSVVHGDVQFFTLDTHMTPATHRWLDHELSISKARWKIAFGHHRLEMWPDLQAALAGRVDIYLGCHEELSHTRPEPSLHQFVSGTAALKEFDRVHGPEAAYRSQTKGVGEIEVEGDRATVRFLDFDGAELYRFDMEKPAA